MRGLKENIKKSLGLAVGLSLLSIGWIFLVDGLLAGEWREFEIIGSVTVCVFVYSILHVIIMYVVPFDFLLEKIVECLALILLWFVFGYFFDWYDRDNWYFVFIYTLPAYLILYLFDLFTLKRDADYVNKRIGKESKR